MTRRALGLNAKRDVINVAPQRFIAELLMLATTFCWASNLVAGKEALEGFNPLALAQLRMAGATLLFGFLFLLWKGRSSLHFTVRQWLLWGLLAITGITLNQICYLGGLDRTSVIHAGLIQALGPVLVLLLAAMVGRESLTIRNVAGMTMAFAGVVVLLPGRQSSMDGAHWTGDVILLAAGTSFAFYTILLKNEANSCDPLTLCLLTFGLGAILLLPFCAPSVYTLQWGRVPFRAWMGLAYMIVFGSLIAYLAYTCALRILSASHAAAFNYLQPAIAAGLGVWLMGEHLTPTALLGGLLILAGVYVTERKGSPPNFKPIPKEEHEGCSFSRCRTTEQLRQRWSVVSCATINQEAIRRCFRRLRISLFRFRFCHQPLDRGTKKYSPLYSESEGLRGRAFGRPTAEGAALLPDSHVVPGICATRIAVIRGEGHGQRKQ